MTKQEIREKVEEWRRLDKELNDAAHYQFVDNDCPLKNNHHGESQALFGTGMYEWRCWFCGETFYE
jgi:hypothetical protein